MACVLFFFVISLARLSLSLGWVGAWKQAREESLVAPSLPSHTNDGSTKYSPLSPASSPARPSLPRGALSVTHRPFDATPCSHAHTHVHIHNHARTNSSPRKAREAGVSAVGARAAPGGCGPVGANIGVAVEGRGVAEGGAPSAQPRPEVRGAAGSREGAECDRNAHESGAAKSGFGDSTTPHGTMNGVTALVETKSGAIAKPSVCEASSRQGPDPPRNEVECDRCNTKTCHTIRCHRCDKDFCDTVSAASLRCVDWQSC